MAVPPLLTSEQRQLARERSLAVRRRRAELKGMMRDGYRLSRVIEEEGAGGVKVIDLLMAVPGVGRQTALRMLAEAGIPEKNTVARCGEKQLARLLSQLDD